MTTREKILSQALNLFSQKGYDPVSVRDIAYAVGIKESSLYNHFTNKQAIFDTLLQEYSARWESFFAGANLTGEDNRFTVDEKTVNMYQQMSKAQFAAMAAAIFDYYMTDEINVKLRKMLTIEQYRNDDIARLFRKISFDDSIEYQAQLFAALIDAGAFIKADPYIMAFEFFSPIFLLFYKFDKDEESLQTAKALFLRHIEFFSATYATKDSGGNEQ